MSPLLTQCRAWLLLIVFSLNAVVPAGAGGWLLCVGCDDVRLTLTKPDSGWLGVAEPCCGTTDASDEDQRPGRLLADEMLSSCDCIRVPVENNDLAVVLSPDDSAPTVALPSETAPAEFQLDLPTGSVTARGPPDADWLTATQTLLGQHTSLII